MHKHGSIFEPKSNHISLHDGLPRLKRHALQQYWNKCIVYIYHCKIKKMNIILKIHVLLLEEKKIII